MRYVWEVEVYFHTFVIVVLERKGCPALRTSRFTCWKESV